MAVNLKKGQKVDLRKTSGEQPGNLLIGLGWDIAEPPRRGGLLGFFAGQPEKPEIDCDASVLMCKNGKLANTKDIVYYGNLEHSSKAVKHTGDNRTGEGDGDDEQIIIKPSLIPSEYDKLIVVVTIYEATERKQHFGMIQNAFIRIVDQDNNMEMCRFDLTDNYSGMKSMIFGEICRVNGEWKFSALGNGTTDDSLRALSNRFY